MIEKLTPVELQQLSERIHLHAVKAGHWNYPRTNEHNLMMVITEIAEAVEADRKDRRVDNVESYIARVKKHEENKQLEYIPPTYEYWIKHTIEEEFADIAIRLIDLVYISKLSFDTFDLDAQFNRLNLRNNPSLAPDHYDFSKHPFVDNAFYLTLSLADTIYSIETNILTTLFELFRWADYLNIDMRFHITEKLRYLEIREARYISTHKKY